MRGLPPGPLARSRPLRLGLAILTVLSLAALAAPLLSNYDPLKMEVAARLRPPSAAHWLGTDEFGRDLFTRIIYGGRISLGVGGSVTLLASILGLCLGLCASYYRSLDALLMRLCDGMMAAPGILLAIAFMSAFGASAQNVVTALTLVYTPGAARIVRASALRVREQHYIDAVRLEGAGGLRIICRHIAPNVLSPLIVQASYIFAEAVISEAGLSFLGAGVPAPAPSWGNIVQSGKLLIFKAWWIVTFPSLAIILAVLSLILTGDGLRDCLDPRRRFVGRAPKTAPSKSKGGAKREDAGSPLLQISGLRVSFTTPSGPATALDGVDLELHRGEALALVGESGCGKSVMAQAILRLHDEAATRYEGSVRLNGRDLLALTEGEMAQVRGREAAMIFQDPMTSLDPVFTVGRQIAETIRGVPAREARRRAEELLALTGLAPDCMRRYPHELSGGMQQRVMIAMSLACRPALLIADEPTTALDVTVQAQILSLLRGLRASLGLSILFISHDLAVVSQLCRRVAVMYLGRIVESAEVQELFSRPLHPYTRGLLASIPPLDGDRRAPLAVIPGAVPSLSRRPEGCPFAPRCGRAAELCFRETPPMRELEPRHFVHCWVAQGWDAMGWDGIGGDRDD